MELEVSAVMTSDDVRPDDAFRCWLRLHREHELDRVWFRARHTVRQHQSTRVTGCQTLPRRSLLPTEPVV